MSVLLRYPAPVLAALGAVSGLLGANVLGGNYGVAPQPGLYLVLTGVWFGLVVGFVVRRFGQASLANATMAILTTWIAWETAVNVAIKVDGPLLGSVLPSAATSYVTGFVAGAIGASVTWAGAAVHVAPLRRSRAAISIVLAGAFLGCLLPATNYYDGGAVLLVPWQAAIAGLIGLNMMPVGGRNPHSEMGVAAEG